MNGSNKDKREECQIEVVYEAGIRPSPADRARNFGLRLLSAFRRRIWKDKYGVVAGVPGDPGVGVNVDSSGGPETPSDSQVRLSFEPGEIVTIKSVEEIQKTLDSNGRCGGLQFMLGMRKYCGQDARVLKKVKTIFDERLWKMVRIRNAYLLENVTCDGRDVFDGEGCDRTCFFFWKSSWLKKKSPTGTCRQ